MSNVSPSSRPGASLVALPGPKRPAATFPMAATSFIGRETDVEEVMALLDHAETRLLTLTGPGGVGKTRLALEVARAIEPDFAHGSAYVRLAAIRDTSLVLPAVARAVGVQEHGGSTLLDQVLGQLHDHHMLLVLDNFEHLLTESPLWLAELIGTCPGIAVLVTSRTNLNITGEFRFVVPPLRVPKGDSDVDGSESGAVTLFVQRARAA